jgi:hypothetical protein
VSRKTASVDLVLNLEAIEQVGAVTQIGSNKAGTILRKPVTPLILWPSQRDGICGVGRYRRPVLLNFGDPVVVYGATPWVSSKTTWSAPILSPKDME